jgi:hypothetical protein
MIHKVTLGQRITERLRNDGVMVTHKAGSKPLNHSVSPTFPPLEVPNKPQTQQRFRETLAIRATIQMNPVRGGRAWV